MGAWIQIFYVVVAYFSDSLEETWFLIEPGCITYFYAINEQNEHWSPSEMGILITN
jgi:hypothetical protein